MIACLAEDKLDLVYTGMVFLIFGCVNKTSHLVTNLSQAVLQSKLGLVVSLKRKIQQKENRTQWESVLKFLLALSFCYS